MTAASNARRALEALQSIEAGIALRDGAIGSMAESLPDGAVDPEAVTRFSQLQAAAEAAGDPALLAVLAQAKVLLEDRGVQEWMETAKAGDDEADQRLVQQLEMQQRRAEASYEAWLAQQQEQHNALERARQEALARQEQLADAAERDTRALDSGEDADYVAEAKESAEYATAHAEVTRIQTALGEATARLAAFDETNADVVAQYGTARDAVDAATRAAAPAASDATPNQRQALALMSSSLRPETPAMATARTAVAGRFTTDAEQTALVEAVRGIPPVAADSAITSLLAQHDAAAPEQRAALCAEIAIHVRQDPSLSAARAMPEGAAAQAAELAANGMLREQMARMADIENIGSVALRNPQAVAALAQETGVDETVRTHYSTAITALPQYDQHLHLTAQRDGLQFQCDGARRARERVVSDYVAEKSLHGVLVAGRQAVESAGVDMEQVFAPQLATIKAFEAKLTAAKEQGPEQHRELIESPEADKVRALAKKVGDAATQFAGNKAQHDFSGFLRQNATSKGQTGHVTNVVTRDAAGNKAVWGRLSAAQTNSQQTLYGGSGSFLWQHMGSTLRQAGLALGLIRSPLQEYRVQMRAAAAAAGFAVDFQKDAAGQTTGLFRFVQNDGSGRSATPKEHSAILQDASARTAKAGSRYYMRIQEHAIDADTAAIERAGEIGFMPTEDATGPRPTRSSTPAPKALSPEECSTLGHQIKDAPDEAIKTYGASVTGVTAALAKDGSALVFEGTGLKQPLMVRAEPDADHEGHFKMVGGDATGGYYFKENDEGDVEFFKQDGGKLNPDQVKDVLAGAAVEQPGVEVLKLTESAKRSVLTPSKPEDAAEDRRHAQEASASTKAAAKTGREQGPEVPGSAGSSVEPQPADAGPAQ